MSTVSSKNGSLRAGCTARAFVTGSLLCAFIGILGPYNTIIRRASYLFLDFASPGPFGLFFYLILFNSLLKAWGGRWLIRGTGWGVILLGVSLPACSVAAVRWEWIHSWPMAAGFVLLGFTAAALAGRVAARRPLVDGGGALYAGACVVLTYLILAGPRPAWIHGWQGPLAVTAVIAAGTVLVRHLRPRWALDSAELLVVMVMMLIGGSVVTMGYMLQIFSFMSAGHFFADASNQYSRYILDNTPSWMIVSDREAVRWFYEGLPRGASVPWMLWAKPFLAWLPLILSVYWVMMCLMVMVRRQWAENERLVYPQAQLPLAMVEEGDGRGAFPVLYRNVLFWVGFGIVFFITSLNGLHGYFSAVPTVTMSTAVPMFRGAAWLALRLSFPWAGLAYLLNLDVGLSLWLFALLAFVQQGIFNIRGIKSEEFLGLYGANTTPIIAHQGMGAFLVFLAVVLWTGRRHLRDVARKAWRNDPAVTDDDEMMSYRGAVIGALTGSGIIWVWMALAGLPIWLGPVFVIVMMGIFFGVTRIVAQGGFPTVRPPSIAQPMMLSGLGSGGFGPSGIVALAFTYAWAADIRTFPMVPAAHAGRMSERIGRRRGLAPAMWLGLLVTLAVSFCTTLGYTHRQGGLNANTWFFGAAQKWAFDYGVTKIRELERTGEVHGARLGGVAVAVEEGIERAPGVLRLEGPLRSVDVGGDALFVDEIVLETDRGAWRIDFEDLEEGTEYGIGAIPGPGEPVSAIGTFRSDAAGPVGRGSVSTGNEARGTGRELFLENAVLEIRSATPASRLELRFRIEGTEALLRVNGQEKRVQQFRADPRVFSDGRVDSTRPYGRGYLHKGIGAAVMSALIFFRNRFYWWPVHPIGYVVGGIWLVQQVWITVFVVWLIKALVLKLGGARAYQRLMPFFLGLILGQFVAALTWVGIDTIFQKTGNNIFWF